jgi:ElaB/YqjD/DUF883 family membrane-anchored ribosome-binding protein
MAKDDTTLHHETAIEPAPPANVGALAVDPQDENDDNTDAGIILKDKSMTSKIRESALADKLRDGGEKLAGQAGDKARDLVGQGLQRTAEALGNVAKMVGDTADGIDERLGAEYGDYARKAAGALDKAAGSIGSKNPDELIDDTRTFVRNSPGLALAGAAVVGFIMARVLKSGLAANRSDED